MNVSEGIRRRLPILVWGPKYPREALGGDVLAGLVVVALAVPQALGYAGIAGVPVVVGIYAIPAALIAYALFGSSPHLVVGPVSTVSVVSGSILAGMHPDTPERAVALTTALAIGSGLGLLAGGLLKLGWAAEFLSRSIVTGFVFGLVLVIIIGEIPKLLGLPPTSGDSIEQVVQILRSITDLDRLTTIVGCAALVVLFAGARFMPRVPWGLIVLVSAIAYSSAAGLEDRGVVVVGPVPSGLPPFGLPGLHPGDIAPILFGGVAMAMVGLAEGLSAARLLAAREGYSIDSNQELIGSGAANIAAGLTGGLGVAGSLSKTAASHRSGGRTQVAGLSAAVMALLVLLLFAEALAPLPRAALSAIVIQAVWGLMDVPSMKRYRWIRRNDFVAAVAAMLGVLLFGPLYGLVIAIGLALLGLVYRSSRIEVEVLGRVPDEKAAWGSIENHPERRTYEGIAVVRLDGPLFWANASDACDGAFAVATAQPGVRAVLLDLEATSQLDVTSIDALEMMRQRLADRGIDLYLVRVFYQARQTLARAGFIEALGEEHMWHSISAGVRAARKSAELRGPARPQYDFAEPDDETEPTHEHIEHDRNFAGGYSDPDREGHVPPKGMLRWRWWRPGR